jgi:hypothetical protein
MLPEFHSAELSGLLWAVGKAGHAVPGAWLDAVLKGPATEQATVDTGPQVGVGHGLIKVELA